MKRILGLDLGTNSIGWALIFNDFNRKHGQIIGLGSRIIPMEQGVLDKFGSGQSISQTADRTGYRGARRLRQRALLRRDRLHRVLRILDFLPEHYASKIDFEKNKGQFFCEVKINYQKTELGKYDFIFMDSFNKMVLEFRKVGFNGSIPFDWTIYYLRKEALQRKISKYELAWILLNFNQKRGYYQLRGEEIEDSNKIEEYSALKVVDVIETDDKNNKGVWYEVHLENGLIYKRQSKISLSGWVGSVKEFIITTNKDKDGKLKVDKDGNIKRNFRIVNSEEDWIAIKKKTENDIDRSSLTVGEYIFNALLKDNTQKVNGKLIKTIERKYYKRELVAILEKQMDFHNELCDSDLYQKCINELYPLNYAYRKLISSRDFLYLFVDDIIFYQRPLKSKKSSIANCSYEKRVFLKDGEKQIVPLKSIPKSNPLYQEFRIWQFIYNLRIIKNESIINGKTVLNEDVTSAYLDSEKNIVDLFQFLNKHKEIDQKSFLKYLKLNTNNYRWNYVDGRKYPCNETRTLISSRLQKIEGLDVDNFLTQQKLSEIWHLIYSITDKNEFETALHTYADKNNILVDAFVNAFKNVPPFKSEYGAYSEKAIKKLLPLMRTGEFWVADDIDSNALYRIRTISERLNSINYDQKRISEITDDDIPAQILKSFISFKDRSFKKGLNTYQACYVVYGRHSEVGELVKWNTPDDIDNYLKSFKQHSLRNPIVEQVVTETLRQVRDIWKFYGNGDTNFFDEIHVELGREMKNSKEKREKISKKQSERENTNNRIKALLYELQNDKEVNGEIRPYSPSHQEILKIYEEGVFESAEEIDDDIIKIRRNPKPSTSDIVRYKLWLEQKYLSPYTGQVISLSNLFSEKYQIEHIIPQSRYFDDSLQNKVICESEVNELKSNMTAYEFIHRYEGHPVPLSNGRSVPVFHIADYENHCKRYFGINKRKLELLLSEEIPEGFINRQLNDSRYISKFIKGLLSNIVREDGEQEATAKRLVPVTGAITSILKNDWGLNDKWNEIIASRFKRLNEITNSNDFGHMEHNFFRIQVPDELSKGFNKKRIDHRHHAMDALVIACTTHEHTNYISNLSNGKRDFSREAKLRNRVELERKNPQTGCIETVEVAKEYFLPWVGFPVEAKEKLEHVIISFKQNLRVINKTSNKYISYRDENGELRVGKDGRPVKGITRQTKGDSWAIRKPLHKDTVSSAVRIKREKKTQVKILPAIMEWQLIVNKEIRILAKKIYKQNQGDKKRIQNQLKKVPFIVDGKEIEKVSIYEYVNANATRGVSTHLNEKFTRKQLEAITDSGIRKIFERHIKNYIDENGKEQFDLAFNTEGLANLNKNIMELNNGKFHYPIYNVRLYEVGSKFSVGYTGNKSSKLVEAAKGTNLFFAIYWNEEKQKRTYETIPLNKVIAHQKVDANLPAKERTPIELNDEMGEFLFSLSPNDLVYVPTDEEINNPRLVNFDLLSKQQVKQIYKMEKASKKECYFIRQDIASLIYPYDSKFKIGELGSQDKLQTTMCKNGFKIIDRCWKLKVDRIGNVVSVIK